jgi:hypothetical protein
LKTSPKLMGAFGCNTNSATTVASTRIDNGGALLLGLLGFDFRKFSPEKLSRHNPAYEYPYLKLIWKLWGGNWRLQLAQLNQHIEVQSTRSRTKRTSARSDWQIFDPLPNENIGSSSAS